MKKLIIPTILMLATIEAAAQKYFDIYQNDVVIERIDASNVDSISITESEPIYVNFYHDNSVFLTYARTAIDSIKVYSKSGKPFSYAGVMGFNQELYPKDINVLATSSISDYKSFIDNLPKKDGTILYYAVDNTLDMIDAVDITTPLSSVNLITFTDGLDQGSLMMNSNYESSDSYLTAMSKRIREAEIQGIPINAYAVGLRGNDVSDVDLFKKNLCMLATSEENAFEVNSIYDLQNRFQSIANQIINTNTRQTLSLRIPGTDNGTRARFTFDGNSPEDSKLYIEGTFNLKDRSLHDVTFFGMKSDLENFVQGTQNGIFVTYTFTGLQRTDGNGLVPTNNIRHYYRNPSSASWLRNSEFTPDGNTQRNDYHSGTIVMLLLDCSSSLGSSDFSNVKYYAKEFLNMVAANTMPLKVTTPQNVSAALDDDDLVVYVSWDAVEDAESYTVYRSGTTYSGDFEKVAENVKGTSWRDTAPREGSNYYKIQAVEHGVRSSLSNYTDCVTCYLSSPDFYATPAVKDNNLVVNVSWNPVKYAQNYDVYRDYKLVAENISATSWTDTTPLEGANYYSVYAKGHGIRSGRSGNTWKQVYVKLSPPSDVYATLDLKDKNLVVNVSWKSVEFAPFYDVYRSSSSSGTYELVAENISATSWTDTTPLTGRNCYKVRASSANGFTSSLSSYNGVYADRYVKATLAVKDNNLVVNVSWNDHGFKYYVYKKSSSSGNYVLVAKNIFATSWTDTTPLNGYNYYEVLAIGYGSMSDQSTYASVNVMSYPSNVTAALDVKDDNLVVNVSWSSVECAQNYDVYRSSSSSGTYELVAENISATSWTDTTPLNGYNYYKVRAKGYGFTSDLSDYTRVIY